MAQQEQQKQESSKSDSSYTPEEIREAAVAVTKDIQKNAHEGTFILGVKELESLYAANAVGITHVRSFINDKIELLRLRKKMDATKV